MKFVDYIKERFDFSPDDFKGYVFISDEKRVYVTTEECAQTGHLPKAFRSYGIIAGRIQRSGRITKPTTNFFQIFGKFAKRNFIELTEEQKESFIRGQDIKPENTSHVTSDGYVIVKFKEHVIGCGLLKSRILYNQLPKTRILRIS